MGKILTDDEFFAAELDVPAPQLPRAQVPEVTPPRVLTDAEFLGVQLDAQAQPFVNPAAPVPVEELQSPQDVKQKALIISNAARQARGEAASLSAIQQDFAFSRETNIFGPDADPNDLLTYAVLGEAARKALPGTLVSEDLGPQAWDLFVSSSIMFGLGARESLLSAELSLANLGIALLEPTIKEVSFFPKHTFQRSINDYLFSGLEGHREVVEDTLRANREEQQRIYSQSGPAMRVAIRIADAVGGFGGAMPAFLMPQSLVGAAATRLHLTSVGMRNLQQMIVMGAGSSLLSPETPVEGAGFGALLGGVLAALAPIANPLVRRGSAALIFERLAAMHGADAVERGIQAMLGFAFGEPRRKVPVERARGPVTEIPREPVIEARPVEAAPSPTRPKRVGLIESVRGKLEQQKEPPKGELEADAKARVKVFRTTLNDYAAEVMDLGTKKVDFKETARRDFGPGIEEHLDRAFNAGKARLRKAKAVVIEEETAEDNLELAGVAEDALQILDQFRAGKKMKASQRLSAALSFELDPKAPEGLRSIAAQADQNITVKRARVDPEDPVTINTFWTVGRSMADLEMKTGDPYWRTWKILDEAMQSREFYLREMQKGLFEGVENKDQKAMFNVEAQERMYNYITIQEAPGLTKAERVVADRMASAMESMEPVVRHQIFQRYLRTGELQSDVTQEHMDTAREFWREGISSGDFVPYYDYLGSSQWGTINSGYFPEHANPLKNLYSARQAQFSQRHSMARAEEGPSAYDPKSPLFAEFYKYMRNMYSTRFRDVHSDFRAMFKEAGLDQEYKDKLTTFDQLLTGQFHPSGDLVPALTRSFWRATLATKPARFFIRNKFQNIAFGLPIVATLSDPIFWKNLRFLPAGGRVGFRGKAVRRVEVDPEQSRKTLNIAYTEMSKSRNIDMFDYFERYVANRHAALEVLYSEQAVTKPPLDTPLLYQGTVNVFNRVVDKVVSIYPVSDLSNRIGTYTYGWKSATDAIKAMKDIKNPTEKEIKRMLRVTGGDITLHDLEIGQLAKLFQDGEINSVKGLLAGRLTDVVNFNYRSWQRGLAFMDPTRGIGQITPFVTFPKSRGETLYKHHFVPMTDYVLAEAGGNATSLQRTRALNATKGLLGAWGISTALGIMWRRSLDSEESPYGLNTLTYVPPGPGLQAIVTAFETAEQLFQHPTDPKGWRMLANGADRVGARFVPVYMAALEALKLGLSQPSDDSQRIIPENAGLAMMLEQSIERALNVQKRERGVEYIEANALEFILKRVFMGEYDSLTTQDFNAKMREHIATFQKDMVKNPKDATLNVLFQAAQAVGDRERRQVPGGKTIEAISGTARTGEAVRRAGELVEEEIAGSVLPREVR